MSGVGLGGSQALTARCPGSPIPESSGAGRAPGSRPRSSCSRGLRASSKIASREGTCLKASATPGVQPGSPHLGPLSRHPAGCPELGAERPRRPGAEEPERTWPPARLLPRLRQRQAGAHPAGELCYLAERTGKPWAPGRPQPRARIAATGSCRGRGRRGSDGGGGGAGGLGAPAGWEDRTQSGCWAKEGRGMEGPTLGREGKGVVLRLFVGRFKSSWSCECTICLDF